MKESIKINQRFRLSLLKKSKHESFIGELKGKGIYICEMPTEFWHFHNNLRQSQSFSIKKKMKFLSLMKDQGFCLSPSGISYKKATKMLTEGNIVHLPNIRAHYRIRQLLVLLQIFTYLLQNRKRFSYVMFYNFEFFFFPSFLLLKILGIKIIVDFEDDYSRKQNKFLSSLLKNFYYPLPDTIICINEKMKEHFGKAKTFVHNGFFSLEYAQNLEIDLNKDNLTLFFGGTIDNIRGAKFIPLICNSLKEAGINYILNITGPCKDEYILNTLQRIKEINYLGFVNENKYKDLIRKSDYCLVLQDPDEEYSKGVYPSKIEYYSSLNKPILFLETC